jgi:hypothetical protein
MPQPLTKAGIANMALSLIGQKPIPSTDTTWVTTKEAVQIAAVWEMARLTTLTAVNWRFARTRIPLVAASGVTPETFTGWEYVYDYPASNHYVWKVFVDTSSPNPDPVEYVKFFGPSTEKLYIATQYDDCYVEATNTSVGTTIDHYLLWDALATMALACQVAALIATQLTGKSTEMERMLKLYGVYIDRATLQNAKEQNLKSTKKETSDLVTARG